MEDLFMNFGSLFTTFSWWSILLIAIVVGGMYPLNLLYKKVMAKASLSRVRKIVAFASTYVISLVLVLAFSKLANAEIEYTADYIFGATLALGFCAQFVWEIIKLIRDYGFAPVLAAIAEKSDWKYVLKVLQNKYSVDPSITDFIADFVEEKYLAVEGKDEVSALLENKADILKEIQDKISGFVDDNDVSEVSTDLFDALVNAWEK